MSDYSDLIQSSFGRGNPALPITVGNIDENPDKAQRSLDLAKVTGVPASAIYGDIDEFERQHKAVAASDIVANNSHLSDWVQSNPMAPKIANDDYGTLDGISQKITNLKLPSSVSSWLQSDSLSRGFVRGWGPQPLGYALLPENETLGPDNRLAEAALRGAASVPELFLRTVGSIITGVSYNIAGEEQGEKLAQVIMDPGLQATLTGLGPPGVLAAGGLGALSKVMGRNAPGLAYIKNGREPPPTIMPELDALRAKQNAADVDALKEATSDAQQSTTRERSPELFRDFIAQHTDAEIGISGDAVAALYGDKLPTPDDGLLGWVPDIEAKLNLARASGDDIAIPLADWLTHIDPKVMDALHDDIRVRPGAITTREAQLDAEAAAAKPPTQPLPEAVPLTRAAAALEPMLSVGDRKLAITRMEQDPKSQFTAAQGFHDFHLLDEAGNKVGYINISEQKGGKDLYVDMVSGINGLGPRDFGPRLMVDLIKQLKAEFPNAERLGGHRVSGAREKAGKEMTMPAAWINLDRPAEWDTPAGFESARQVLEGGQWETYAPGLRAYIKPFHERAEADRQLIDLVQGELGRIISRKVSFEPADRIESTGASGQFRDQPVAATGVYLPSRHAYPIILYALRSDEPLGSAYHEAIHHLRQYGFFNKAEWGILEKAAQSEGWLDRYDINKRYPTGTRSLKLEESIAEAFKDWEAGKLAASMEVHTLFETMKQFFDAIREKIAQLLGKDPTWQDIFQRVDTGEVGARESIARDPRAYDPMLSAEDSQSPKAANDIDAASGRRRPSYTGAVNQQRIERFVDKDTKTGDFEYWQKIAEQENHVLAKSPNAYAAARAHSEGGKTTMIIDANGRRVVYRDGVKVAKELHRDVGSLDPMLSVPPTDTSRPFERAAALGMTVDQFKAYDKLIQQRHAEDVAKATERAQKSQAREQTKEWKANRADLRKEVADSIRNRPDVATDLFLAGDGLYGRQTKQAYKLDADLLSDKQKAMLPPNYYAKGGLAPDDVANMFGYGSGDAMVDKLINYNVGRRLANMNSRDYVGKVIDLETDRQMRTRYGNLDENIMDAVKEQVAGQTQLNILHEETVALGLKAGQDTTPFTKQDILGWVKAEFAKTTIGSVSSDRYLATAGRAGKAAEMALLNNDPATAFQQKQRQYYATALAREAAQLENDLGKFEKLAKRFSKREVSGIDVQYTNFIQDILQRVGKPVRRSVQDLATAIQAGEYHSLQEFVEGKNTFYLREVAVADLLFDSAFRKKFESLTTDEFNAINTSIKSLVKNGRDEQKITKAGEEADLRDIKTQMISQLEQFKERTYDAKGGRWMGPIPPRIAKGLRTFGVAHIQLENLFNRWDRDDSKGVFQQYVMRDLVDASNNESVMEKRYADRLRQIDDKADLKASVDNPIFKVPGTDSLMKFNRGNLRTIMLNMGNDGNMYKMAKGYKVEPAVMAAWVHRHATKADWDWVQGMWDVFADLKGEADTMYRGLSGVAPESIPIKPVDTPHGQYAGGYYPVIWHPEFEGPSKKLMGKDALEQGGFVRATVANGYTKQRTGYVGPMALDLDMLPARMKQMVHDVAMRPAVINASKIFYDKDIGQAIFKHFGAEWRDMLKPYLVDVANSANYVPKDQRMFYNASEFLRQNLVSTLVGLNPGTVLKHGPTAAVQSLHEVGTVNFLKALKSLFAIDERTGESNWQFAMKESEELQRRHQNYVETLGGATDLLMPKSGFASLRATVQRFAAAPVAISDLLSAVPTWLAQYEKSLADNGGIHGDAVYDANRAVRRAHGSVAITNRSTVMRGGALGQWFASVYGFFNHIMNRQYELLWKSGEALDMVKQGEYKAAMQQAPELTSMLFAYVLAPALIEEMVTPLMSSENESWGKKAAKGLAFTLGASWVGVRDIANAILNGRDPSVGLISTFGKSITDVARDLGKQGPFNKEHAGKIVKDGTTLLGSLTGVVPAQTGRVAEFGYGTITGTERPKGPWGWMVGARYGTLKGHSKTFDEWQRHH